MFNKRNKQPVNNQSGLVSLIVVSILAVVLGLIAVGFSQLMDREARRALDNELSAQAYYSAIAGLNDSKAYLADCIPKGGNCDLSGCSDWQNSALGKEYFTSDLGSSGTAKYSCVAIDTQPKELKYDNLAPGQSVSYELKTGTTVTQSIVAPGGGGGDGASISSDDKVCTAGSGGSGGVVSVVTDISVHHNGGNGGKGYVYCNNGATEGGAGGSSAGTAADGNNGQNGCFYNSCIASGGTAPLGGGSGGNTGWGINGPGPSGTSGAYPGGGAGASGATQSGDAFNAGNGANGKVVVAPNTGSPTTYTSAGNWSYTVPSGVTSLVVELWGAGGGSGRGLSDGTGTSQYYTGKSAGGGGGGGGAYVKTTSISVSAGQTLSIIVGAGGAAGSAPTPGAGQTAGSGSGGGSSSISYQVISASNRLDSLYFSWQNSGDSSPQTLSNTLGLLPREQNLSPHATGVLKVSIYPAPNAVISSSAISQLSRTYYLYPNGGSANQYGSAAWSSGGYSDSAGLIGNNGNFVPGKCSSSNINAWTPLPDPALSGLFCNSAITNLQASGVYDFYVTVTALYQHLTINTEAANSSNQLLPITGVQAVVDVTGQGTDVLQRIRARLELSDSLESIGYGIQSMQALCKGSSAEVISPTDYGNITLAPTFNYTNGGACQSPDIIGTQTPIVAGGVGPH